MCISVVYFVVMCDVLLFIPDFYIFLFFFGTVCEDPCQAPRDPCKLRRSNGNTCMMALGPNDQAGSCPSARICSCQAPFVLASNFQSCVACGDVCKNDPCDSAGNPGNICKVQEGEPGKCPSKYQCSCASSWLDSDGACLDCKDPCAADPCRSGMNKDNVCRHVFDRGSKCPTKFECACQGVGFLTPRNKKSCTGICRYSDIPCLCLLI